MCKGCPTPRPHLRANQAHKLGAHVGMGTGAPYPPAHNDNVNRACANPEAVPLPPLFLCPLPLAKGALKLGHAQA